MPLKGLIMSLLIALGEQKLLKSPFLPKKMVRFVDQKLLRYFNVHEHISTLNMKDSF